MAVTVGPDKKVPLPEDVAREMRLEGLLGGGVTKSYNEFHERLARAELARIIERYGLEVMGERIRDEGWFDGHKVLQVDVLTRTKRHVRLEWVDSNQAFFKKYLTAGSKGMLFESDLA